MGHYSSDYEAQDLAELRERLERAKQRAARFKRAVNANFNTPPMRPEDFLEYMRLYETHIKE